MCSNQISSDRNETDRQPQSRRSRFTRGLPSRFILQPRDTEFLVEVYRSRLLSRDQAISLGFWTSVPRANARCRLLFDAGLLARHFPPYSRFGAQALYSLGRAGCPLVAAATGADPDQVARNARAGESPQFVAHTLAITDLRIALATASENAGVQMAWRSEIQVRHEYRVRKAGGAGWETEILKPDGYARSGDGVGARHAFVEADLGHVSLVSFAKNVRSYVRYRQAVFEQTYGASRFTVLCVVPGERRLRHLADVAGREGGAMFRLATYDRVGGEGALASIWLAPGAGAATGPWGE